MQVSKCVLHFLNKLQPFPLSNLFTASRTVHDYSISHSTAMKLKTPPTRTVVIIQYITKMGPLIWNCLSTDLQMLLIRRWYVYLVSLLDSDGSWFGSTATAYSVIFPALSSHGRGWPRHVGGWVFQCSHIWPNVQGVSSSLIICPLLSLFVIC